jgi:photosystem II stability/assembly factor-like uncharacterized protein
MTSPLHAEPVPLRLTRYNPPGRPELSYHGSRFRETLARMLDQLTLQTAPDRGADQAPLASLNTDGYGDWTIALVQAWAATLEVLAFYQERIVNEGYLRTATERRSVLELARSLGYELRPGTAASTHLVLTVLADKNQPHRIVDVPAGVAIHSVPPPGQLPQTFEIDQPFVGHADWNALKLAPGTRPRRLRLRATTATARIAGTQSGLQPGDYLLILEGPPISGSNQPFRLVQVTAVQPDPAQGCTQLAWNNVAQSDPAAATMEDARLFALRSQTGLLAYIRGGVYLADAQASTWAPAGVGLPYATVYALLARGTDHLVAGTAQGLYQTTDQGATWQQVPAGLVRRPVMAFAAGSTDTHYAGATEGTVYVARGDGPWTVLAGETVLPPLKGLSRLWTPPDAGMLPKAPIRALAAYARGRTGRLAAGTEAGVFRSGDGGRSWQPANAHLPAPDPKSGQAAVAVHTLAVKNPARRAQLFAGTDAGVFHIAEGWSRWLTAAVLAVVALLLASRVRDPHLLTRLTRAAHRLVESAFDRLNSGLDDLFGRLQDLPFLQERLPPPFQVPPLPDPDGTLKPILEQVPLIGPWLAANYALVTDVLVIFAVLTALLLAVSWLRRRLARRPAASLGRAVFALVEGPRGHLVAATAQGVFRSNDGPANGRLAALLHTLARWLAGDGARRWQPAGSLAGRDVRSLAITAGGLLAGTANGQVFTSADDGATWTEVGTDLPLQGVRALSTLGPAIVAAGDPPADPIERRWTPAQLAAHHVDLDRQLPGVTVPSWMVVLPATATPPPALYQVDAVATTATLDPARSAPVTRLTADRGDGLAALDRATTQVLLRSEALPLFDDHPLTGDQLMLSTVVPHLEPGHVLVVSGKLKRLRVVGDTLPELWLLADGGRRREAFQAGESLQTVAVSDAAADGTHRWLLRNRDGFTGHVDLPDDVVQLDPARPDDGVLSELAVLRAAIDSPTQTRLALEARLMYAYDPATVTIYGNVVHATHGQTVTGERLAADEAEPLRRSFSLRQLPLTYVAGADGIESTLAVQVNGVTWHAVSTLHGHDGDDRIFVVRHDAAGRTQVVFGDALHGAALPAGDATATYRRGSGAAGNVAANSLKMLQTAVPGIQAVVNPLAAQGGSDAESAGAARTQAPLAVRAMDRIVSLVDVEDFVRRFPGVGQAAAQVLPAPGGTVLHVTIAGTTGNTVSRDADFVHALGGAIAAARATPTPAVVIDGYEPVHFDVRAVLLLEPDHAGRRATILSQARAALDQTFVFARRAFTQPVASSEVVALLQAIVGVQAVDLQALHVHGEPPALHHLLPAQPARWVDDQLRPAQMLLINEFGIDLEARV